MNVFDTEIPDVKILEPKAFSDDRGLFMETWNEQTFQSIGIDLPFVQDNHSQSRAGVLRGLHYQIRQPQGKLVRVSVGAVFDVAVDLRRSSPTFGRWVGVELSAANQRMLWIPPGFAHGFLSLQDGTVFLYKCTDFYAPTWDRTLIWNDEDIGIRWPLLDEQMPLLSPKDQLGTRLSDAECFE